MKKVRTKNPKQTLSLPETMIEVRRLFTDEEIVRFVNAAYIIEAQCELRAFVEDRHIKRSIAARKGWRTRKERR